MNVTAIFPKSQWRQQESLLGSISAPVPHRWFQQHLISAATFIPLRYVAKYYACQANSQTEKPIQIHNTTIKLDYTYYSISLRIQRVLSLYTKMRSLVLIIILIDNHINIYEYQYINKQGHWLRNISPYEKILQWPSLLFNPCNSLSSVPFLYNPADTTLRRHIWGWERRPVWCGRALGEGGIAPDENGQVSKGWSMSGPVSLSQAFIVIPVQRKPPGGT